MKRLLSLAIPSFEDFPSGEALSDRLSEISGWGYDAVEPMICRPDAVDADLVTRVLETHGLSISGFRTGLVTSRDGLVLSSPEEDVRNAAVRRLCEIVELAGHFPGATILNGLIQGPVSGETVGGARARIVECFQEVCSFARSRSVSVCLEAVNRYELPYHNTLEDIASIVGEVPDLRILIDTFHMNIEEVDMAAEIVRFGSYIGGVHLADSQRGAPGSGHIDFPAVIRALDAARYQGPLTVELGSNQESDEAFRAGARYARARLQSGHDVDVIGS